MPGLSAVPELFDVPGLLLEPGVEPGAFAWVKVFV